MNIFVGFLCAALAGLGIGGGGLLVLWLVLVCGLEQHASQAVNLLFFLFSAGASMLVHLLRRRLDFRLIAFLLALAIPGALLGTAIGVRLDGDLLRRCYGAFLTVTALLSLLRQ